MGLLTALLVVAGPARADLLPGSYALNGQVLSVAHVGSYTYLGGNFSGEQAAVGGGVPVAAGGTGQPDASSFEHVAGTVNAVAGDGAGGWYIGGDFTGVSGHTARNLAHIASSGSLDQAWSADTDGTVLALAVAGGKLYVGGGFQHIGGQTRNNLAAATTSDGQVSAWNPDPDGTVEALVVSGSNVYAGGTFQHVGPAARLGLAEIDTTTGLAAGFTADASGDGQSGDTDVRSLALSGSTLYVGGAFTQIGGQSRAGIASVDAATGAVSTWNPSSYVDYGVLVPGRVDSLAVSGTTVYVGGSFDGIGGQARSSLAALDTTTGNATSWNPNGGYGLFDVTGLAVSGSTLYVAGGFGTLGGQSRLGAAALDTTTALATSWNPGAPGARAVASAAGTVYVGGAIHGAGPNIASLIDLVRVHDDGTLDTSWAPNPDSTVNAMTPAGSLLYIGGFFQQVHGSNRQLLAAVDLGTGAPTSWNPGADNTVYAMTSLGSTIYVGGYFTHAGGQSRNGIAGIDATSGLATGFNPAPDLGNSITGLATDGSAVLAGGVFSHIGGQSRPGLAALDPLTGAATAWHSAVTGSVYALAVHGKAVYAQEGSDIKAFDATTAAMLPFSTSLTSDQTTYFTYPLGATATRIYAVPRGVLSAADANSGEARSIPAAPRGSTSAFDVAGSTIYSAGWYTTSDGSIVGPFARIDDSQSEDATPPQVAITTPTEGQHFGQGQAVTSSFSCDDPRGSGIATCTGPATVDTSTTGAKTFTVSATDVAGNSAQKVVNYIVDAVAAPPAGGGGTPTASVSAAQIKSLLAALLTPTGKPAKIKALVKAGAFSQLFKALTAGKATINWYQLPPGAKLAKKAKPVRIATGTHAFAAAGTATIKIKLTSTGKRLLKHAKKLKLTAQGTFTPTGQAPVTTTKTFTLKK